MPLPNRLPITISRQRRRLRETMIQIVNHFDRVTQQYERRLEELNTKYEEFTNKIRLIENLTLSTTIADSTNEAAYNEIKSTMLPKDRENLALSTTIADSTNVAAYNEIKSTMLPKDRENLTLSTTIADSTNVAAYNEIKSTMLPKDRENLALSTTIADSTNVAAYNEIKSTMLPKDRENLTLSTTIADSTNVSASKSSMMPKDELGMEVSLYKCYKCEELFKNSWENLLLYNELLNRSVWNHAFDVRRLKRAIQEMNQKALKLNAREDKLIMENHQLKNEIIAFKNYCDDVNQVNFLLRDKLEELVGRNEPKKIGLLRRILKFIK